MRGRNDNSRGEVQNVHADSSARHEPDGTEQDDGVMRGCVIHDGGEQTAGCDLSSRWAHNPVAMPVARVRDCQTSFTRCIAPRGLQFKKCPQGAATAQSDLFGEAGVHPAPVAVLAFRRRLRRAIVPLAC